VPEAGPAAALRRRRRNDGARAADDRAAAADEEQHRPSVRDELCHEIALAEPPYLLAEEVHRLETHPQHAEEIAERAQPRRRDPVREAR